MFVCRTSVLFVLWSFLIQSPLIDRMTTAQGGSVQRQDTTIIFPDCNAQWESNYAGTLAAPRSSWGGSRKSKGGLMVGSRKGAQYCCGSLLELNDSTRAWLGPIYKRNIWKKNDSWTFSVSVPTSKKYSLTALWCKRTHGQMWDCQKFNIYTTGPIRTKSWRGQGKLKKDA